MLEFLLAALGQVLMPANLIYLLAGVLLGLIVGAIPGLTASMAIALIIPFTYTLTPTQSIIMLLASYNASAFGGSLSAILIGTPGTPAAAATVADGYSMGLQGKAGKAIKTALFSSAFGCLFSSIILILVAQPIAKYALKFGAAEYTVLMLFSLTIIATAAGKNMFKGLLGGALGLLFGCVGMDYGFTSPRFSFGVLKLTSGIELVVLLIGMLAMSEILKQVEGVAAGNKEAHLPPPKSADDSKFTKADVRLCLPHWLRSSALGCGIGALPGLGPALACYVGYNFAMKSSKHPQEFGKGSIEGVAAAEAANNAVCGANMIPLLSLGVPGDTGAALLMGAFLIQGLTPGPLVFSESPQTVYNVYIGLLLSNLVLVCVVLLLWRVFTKICSVQTTIIFPVVLMFCVVGVYALNSNLTDVWIMLFFAVLGYLLTKFKYPLATVLIGFILSPLFEKNFRRALVLSKGNFMTFFSSPLCWICWAATILSVFFLLRGKKKDKALMDE